MGAQPLGELRGPSPLLSIDQAARLLRLEEDVVKALAESGHLPAIRVGQRWRIPPNGIDEFYARICRDEVPRDVTPINGYIVGPRAGAAVGHPKQRITPVPGKKGEKRGAA